VCGEYRMVLPDDSLEKWTYKEHTKVKHAILSKYLDAWIRILGRHYKKVCYFDCFAGKGQYSDGEKGSPVIALESVSKLKKQFTYLNEIACTFIEKNKNNYDNLKKIIDEELQRNPEKYSGITVSPINDEFVSATSKIIKGEHLPPSFFFIDPFGFSGVPLETIKDILSNPKREVFITFMVRDVNRFLYSSNHRISIKDLYGIDDVVEILSNSNLPKEQALLKLYRKQLHGIANAKYTLPFKINADERLQTTYYLIHATNHPLGCEIMKEIMYKAGTEGRFGYLGPAEGQMTLTQYHDLSKFKEYLQKRFYGRNLTYKNVRHETLMETEFIKKHYRDALLELESEGKVSINGKGPKGGLPNHANIMFESQV